MQPLTTDRLSPVVDISRPALERIGLGGVLERPTLRPDGDRILARRLDLQRLAARRAGGR